MTAPSDHIATPSLTAEEARRLALAAQGMASSARPAASASWRRIAAAIDTMNLLQIDSVNVVARSHYLPVLARVGHYRLETLDARAFSLKSRRLFECWAHEASLLPLQLHPLMRWRMKRAAQGIGIYKGLAHFAEERAGYVDRVRRAIRERGPLRASELPDAGSKDSSDWWSWSDGKTAVEYLFSTGEVTTAERLGNFERRYDIPERVIPSDILNAPTPDDADAIRALVELSAKALGIATERDLRDYFRLPLADARRAVAELVEAGTLEPCQVDGWRNSAYLYNHARLPRRATGTALLSPFDPLVWFRDRAARVFGFDYRIEIYTPAARRKYGYYVLPFLMKGRLTGRVCLKSDRKADALLVNASHIEPGHDHGDTAAALANTLDDLRYWLGLERIEVAAAGDLSAELALSVSRL